MTRKTTERMPDSARGGANAKKRAGQPAQWANRAYRQTASADRQAGKSAKRANLPAKPRRRADKQVAPIRQTRSAGRQTNAFVIGQTRNRNNSARAKQGGFRKKQKPIKQIKTEKKPPELLPDNIRIIPLGGVEEVGKNMMLVEYQNDILVFDAGVQFTTEEDSPGVDYILPNTKYLEERKNKIRGLIITHGHLDHIGGIPYIMERIGNPPIYTSNLTAIMIQKRMSEFPTHPPIDYRIVEAGEKIKLGGLKIKFFPVTHSIPEALGSSVETPYGNIIITGDIRLEHNGNTPSKKEEKNWGEIGQDNNLLLIADSTNVEKPGYSMSEKVVYDNLEQIIKNTTGRLIIGTFASQFERMIKIVEIAEKYGKKVITEGRSIKTNMEIAKLAKLLMPKKDTMISAEEIGNYPPNRIVILATGAQGEEFAALMRIALKQHKYISFNEKDTVVLSSSIVPGNELSVQKLKDNLCRNNLKIIHYGTSDVHFGGHGYAQELAWIHQKVGAKFFVPAYGCHFMLKTYTKIVKSLGFPTENIVVPDNGTIIEIQDKGKKITSLKEKAPSGIMMVDGFSIGDMQEVVIRDRQNLAQDGIFVVIATVDLNTGRLRKSPDIISRGFIYLRESQDLLKRARYITKKTVESSIKGMRPIDFGFVKKEVTDSVGRYLFQTTNKRPMVIPVILGV